MQRIYTETMLRHQMFTALRDHYKESLACCGHGKGDMIARLRKLSYQDMREEYVKVFGKTIEQAID
jgi:hypothetical protein